MPGLKLLPEPLVNNTNIRNLSQRPRTAARRELVARETPPPQIEARATAVSHGAGASAAPDATAMEARDTVQPALARARRETNDARQRVAVLSRARPQNHDTPSVAAALKQRLQSLQTSYVSKATDIASRAPRRPAENVIRILERHARSRDVRGAFHRIKTRMFQERAVEKAAARRAVKDAALALERKRVLERARELDSMSDGLEALRDLAHRKRRERFAEIACDTRRAFAFFAAMRPRLARKRLESRAAGVASLLRVRSCFRTLRAQARRGKLVREISRSALRRSARRALGALQRLRLRGVERRIALLRADRVAKASAARRSVRAFVEGAAFNRTSRQAALLADAAARRRGLTCFALSATARAAARCAPSPTGQST